MTNISWTIWFWAPLRRCRYASAVRSRRVLLGVESRQFLREHWKDIPQLWWITTITSIVVDIFIYWMHSGAGTAHPSGAPEFTPGY